MEVDVVTKVSEKLIITEITESVSSTTPDTTKMSEGTPPVVGDDMLVIEELSDSDSGVGSVASNVSKGKLSGGVSGTTSGTTSDSENSKDSMSGNSRGADVVLMRSGVNGGNLTTLLKGANSDSTPAISAVNESGKVKMTFDDGVDIKKMDEEKLGEFVKTLSREQLDQIVKEKIIKCWNLHTTVGQMNRKLLETEAQKDRLVRNVFNLERQVIEMMKAVRSMAENSGRNRNGLHQVKQDQQPLRFYRSVGVQVVVDSALVKHPSTGFPAGKIVAPKNVSTMSNIAKSANNINVVRSVVSNVNRPAGLQINGNSNLGQKRVMAYQTMSSPTQTAVNTITTDAHGNKVRIIGESQPNRLIRPMTTSITSIQRPMTTIPITTAGVQSVQRAVTPRGTSGILVDLTADDETPVTTNQNVIMTSSGNMVIPKSQGQVLLSGNNVPLRFVSSSQNQPFQLLSGTQVQVINGSPTRPVLFGPGTTIAGLSQGGSPLLQSGQVVMQRATATPVRAIAPRTPTVTAVRIAGATATVVRPISTPRMGGQIGGVSSNRAPAVIRAPVERKFNLPPLPVPDITPKTTRGLKDLPPQPELTLKEQNGGIVLSWTHKTSDNFADIATYQLFACQESLNSVSQKAPAWRKVGDVKSLPLPMACTLSQFSANNRYHFIVRGVDVHNRTGAFCQPAAITLNKRK